MDISITGTVKQILEEQSGTSKNGTWRKQEFILETEGEYPKPVCIVQWGEKIDEFGVEEGERLIVSVDIQSREFKGRWYTDVKAWRVQREAAGASGMSGGEEPFPAPPAPGEPDDDLPF